MYKKSSPKTIQQLFAAIAPRYDLANTLFTFGMHKRWNGQLIKALAGCTTLLDLCAGTGEISFGFLKQNPLSRAILLDFCKEMLQVAKEKGAAFKGRFDLLQHDAQKIPLADQSVDGISISYGIRNVKEPMKCFYEAYRVLAPGGRFGILELTRPSNAFVRKGHSLYTRLALPTLGKIATNNKEAYNYLVSSVQSFLPPGELSALIKKAGFSQIECRPIMKGIATLFVCIKK